MLYKTKGLFLIIAADSRIAETSFSQKGNACLLSPSASVVPITGVPSMTLGDMFATATGLPAGEELHAKGTSQKTGWNVVDM